MFLSPLFLAILKDVKRKIEDLMPQSKTTPSSKRPSTFFQEMIHVLNQRNNPFIENFNGEGSPFLDQNDHSEYLSGYIPSKPFSESTLVQNAYPIFNRKLLINELIDYQLINSESHGWLPPSFNYLYSKDQLLKPDLFIALSFLVEFKHRKNAPVSQGGCTYKYGKLKNINTYPSILILDAKSSERFSDGEIGDFFNYFHNPTIHFKCKMKGMLFNQQEFVLVEFDLGYPCYYLRGKLTSNGTLKQIQDFFIPCDKRIHDSFFDAFQYYKLSSVHYSSLNKSTIGSALLGMGSFGIVIKVQNESGVSFALKVIQTIDDDSTIYDFEYHRILNMMTSNPQTSSYLVGVVEGSLYTNEPLNFVSFLMPTIGVPFKDGAMSISDKQDIIRSLSDLHILGYVHGDARYQNCVKVGTATKWIDFYTNNGYSPVAISKDLKTLLKSFGKTPTKDQLTFYSSKIFDLTWVSPTKKNERNNYIYSLLM